MESMAISGALVGLAVVAGVCATSTACGVNMVFTVRASRDRATWPRIAVAYMAGSLVGSLLLGVALALANATLTLLAERFYPASSDWTAGPVAVLLLLAVILGLREVGVARFDLPQRASQLNSDGLRIGAVHRLFWFGAWLGAAVLTFSPYGGLYLLIIASLLAPDPAVALALFVAFGLARGATVLLAAMAAATWDDASRIADLIAGGYRQARMLTAAAMAAVAITSLVRLA